MALSTWHRLLTDHLTVQDYRKRNLARTEKGRASRKIERRAEKRREQVKTNFLPKSCSMTKARKIYVRKQQRSAHDTVFDYRDEEDEDENEHVTDLERSLAFDFHEAIIS